MFFPSTLTRNESDALVGRIEARFDAPATGSGHSKSGRPGSSLASPGLAPMPEDVPGGGGTEIGSAAGQARLGAGVRHRGGAGRP